nr:hypothetical protein BaRGS_005195 [Batillaria attramentaria]
MKKKKGRSRWTRSLEGSEVDLRRNALGSAVSLLDSGLGLRKNFLKPVVGQMTALSGSVVDLVDFEVDQRKVHVDSEVDQRKVHVDSVVGQMKVHVDSAVGQQRDSLRFVVGQKNNPQDSARIH